MISTRFGVKYCEPRNVLQRMYAQQRRDHQAAQVERAALKRELHAAKWDKRTRNTVFGKPT